MRLGTYKGIHMTRPNTEVTKHEVLNVLKKKQKEYAVATNIDDRSAQEGDQVILDFQGMYHGQDIPHGNGSDFALTIGAKAFLPEFDDALIGKNIGDTFDINVTFPTDYRISTMQNRSVVFHTTLKKIRLMDYQPIDDEFAKDFSEYTTLNEWENEIFSHLQARRKTSVQEKLTREVMTKIIADSDIPIDDDMKERIRMHQERRDPEWGTYEGYRDLGEVVKNTEKNTILLDCVTVMITNILFEEEERDFDKISASEVEKLESEVIKELTNLVKAIRDEDKTLIIVSNEVGMSIVPSYRLGRIFSDISGKANQVLASLSDEVYVAISGLPLRLK